MTSQWIQSSGRLVFRPDYTKYLRKVRPADQNLLILTADKGLSNYYRYWIKKSIHLDLGSPMLSEHISVFNGKEQIDSNVDEYLQSLHGRQLNFEYSPKVEQHWKFWVLPVRCDYLQQIRKTCGLKPDYHFHITIGRML